MGQHIEWTGDIGSSNEPVLLSSARPPFAGGRLVAVSVVLKRPEFWASLVLHGVLLAVLMGLWEQETALPLPSSPPQAYLLVDTTTPTAQRIDSATSVNLERKALPPLAFATSPTKVKIAKNGLALESIRATAVAAVSTERRRWIKPPPSFESSESESSDLNLPLRRHLQRFVSYPRLARRSGIEGMVHVRVRLDGEGYLQSAEVVGSSGHVLLDEAALDLVSVAQPFPSPLQLAGIDRLVIDLPVDYRLDSFN